METNSNPVPTSNPNHARPANILCNSHLTRKQLLALIASFALSSLVLMAPWVHSAFTAAALNLFPLSEAAAGIPTDSDSSVPSWQNPAQTDINDLNHVINGKGVYGFIYDSSHTPDDKYGIYNWCNMPHVRRHEYAKPEDDFELVYVEVVRENPFILPSRVPQTQQGTDKRIRFIDITSAHRTLQMLSLWNLTNGTATNSVYTSMASLLTVTTQRGGSDKASSHPSIHLYNQAGSGAVSFLRSRRVGSKTHGSMVPTYMESITTC
jgi:hypothetical protein